MTHYRVYMLSAAGRIASGSFIESIDDDEIYLLVQAMLTEDNMAEIWSGIRRVGVVAANSAHGSQIPQRTQVSAAI